jgi:hypothetical protein
MNTIIGGMAEWLSTYSSGQQKRFSPNELQPEWSSPMKRRSEQAIRSDLPV